MNRDQNSGKEENKHLSMELTADGARVTNLSLDGTRLILTIEAELADSHLSTDDKEKAARAAAAFQPVAPGGGAPSPSGRRDTEFKNRQADAPIGGSEAIAQSPETRKSSRLRPAEPTKPISLGGSPSDTAALGFIATPSPAAKPQTPPAPAAAPAAAPAINLDNGNAFPPPGPQPQPTTDGQGNMLETWDHGMGPVPEAPAPKPAVPPLSLGGDSAVGGERHGEPQPAFPFGMETPPQAAPVPGLSLDAAPPAQPAPFPGLSLAEPAAAPTPGLSLGDTPAGPAPGLSLGAPAPSPTPGLSLDAAPVPGLSLDAPAPAAAPFPGLSLDAAPPAAPGGISLGAPAAAPGPGLSLDAAPGLAFETPAPAPAAAPGPGLSLDAAPGGLSLATPSAPGPGLSLDAAPQTAPGLAFETPAPAPAPAPLGGLSLAGMEAPAPAPAPVPAPPPPPAAPLGGLNLEAMTAEKPLPPASNPAQEAPTLPAFDRSLAEEKPAAKPQEQEKSEGGGTTVLIRYTCPKCKTQGMQAVDKVGTVVNCSNCGKAMRLVMKK